MIGLLFSVPLLLANEEPKRQTPSERFRALVKEYEAASKQASDGHKLTEEYAARFLELAERNPADPASVEALSWIIDNCMSRPPYIKSVDLLVKRHLQDKNIPPIVRRLAFHGRYGGGAAEKLFRAAIDRSDNRETRAWSCFGLAQSLRQRAQEGNLADIEAKKLLQEAEKQYGELAAHYGDIKPPKELMKELTHQVPEVAGKYGSIWPAGCSLADMSKNELFVLRHLAIGKAAPEITGQDVDGKPMKLSDYRGKVVLLDFWGSW
jgi:hypothetical protein